MTEVEMSQHGLVEILGGGGNAEAWGSKGMKMIPKELSLFFLDNYNFRVKS